MRASWNRRLMLSGMKPTLHANAPRRDRDPSDGDAPLLGTTCRARAPLSGNRIVSGQRTLSRTYLQPQSGGWKRRIDIQHSQPCPGVTSLTSSGEDPTSRSECRKSALTPIPRGIRSQFAPPHVEGYKMLFSGGFLFRAAGSAGVQFVTFAGVLVPQVWNQQGHQSVSRIYPVGARLRLYYGVHASCMSSSRNIEFMYTSRTSPNTSKSSCYARRGLQGPSFGTLHPAPPTGRLECGGNDPYSEVRVPFAYLAKQPFNGVTHNRIGTVGASTNRTRILTRGHSG